MLISACACAASPHSGSGVPVVSAGLWGISGGSGGYAKVLSYLKASFEIMSVKVHKSAGGYQLGNWSGNRIGVLSVTRIYGENKYINYWY